MPSTRKSTAGPLEPLTNNIQKATVSTPGKQVKHLKEELAKKADENDKLRNDLAGLEKALEGLNLVKDRIEDDGSSTAAATTKKTKKDKDAPVPAKTAYKIFCDAFPKKDGVDMRQMWKECDPDVRQNFIAKAEADKARYQSELHIYQQEKDALEMYYEKKKQDAAMEFYEAHLAAQVALDSAAEGKKGKKKTKDPDAPKRPTSAYMYFAKETRESVTKKNPNASMVEISKILGEMWNKRDKGKKGKNGTKKFDDLAAADKARYEVEKAEYDAKVAGRNAKEAEKKAERLVKDKEEAMTLMKTFQVASEDLTNETISMTSNIMEDISVVSDLTSVSNGGKKPKKKKDPNAPKNAKSAYIFFTTENRSAIKASMKEETTQTELFTEIGRQWKALSDKKKEKYVQMANGDKERYAQEMEEYNACK